jgi:hypothetical protein
MNYTNYIKIDIKKIIELVNKENYDSISQKIRLYNILKELSYLDFVFIANIGFAVYNNSLDKGDLDKILSNDRKDIYMLMFHTN